MPEPERDEWDYRPVLRVDGGWAVEDGHGYGPVRIFSTREEAEAYILGWEDGARENR